MLGKRIAELRRQHGMSQQKLAAYLEVSPSTIGMYEQGRREPSVKILVDLASVFGVSLDYLLTGVPSDPQDQQAVRQWFEDLKQELKQAVFVNEQGNRRSMETEDLALLLASLLQDTP